MTTSIVFPPFRFDEAQQLLWREETLLTLRPKTAAVLQYLLARPSQLVSRTALLQALWPGQVISTAAVKQCIRELRRVFNDDPRAPRFIETVGRKGYRFIAPLTAAAPPVPRSTFHVPRLESTRENRESSDEKPETLLVGREAEVRQLHDSLLKAEHGERQVVFVSGEPGIGKTTLIEAFLAGIGRQGTGNGRQEGLALLQPTPDAGSLLPVPRIAWGQCIEHYGSGEPYLPILEAVERLKQQSDHGQLLTAFRQYAPLWLAQLPSWISPKERDFLKQEVLGATRERMLREFAMLVEALTAATPLVLVLEDLHWSDPSTIELLASLARRQEPARLLILGTYRPMELTTAQHLLSQLLPELQGHHFCQALHLEGLDENAVAAYLRQRLPISTLPTRLPQVIQKRTGGNPLFVTNLVDDLIAQRLLTNSEGVWSLAGGVEAVERHVPESSRQFLTRQIERLASEEHRVLAAASVAGAEFSAAAVAAELAQPLIAIELRCEALARRQTFVQRAGVSAWPDGTVAARYSFRHALYQNVWHEQVPVAQRRQWHQHVGERLETAYGESARDIAAELAVHFTEARDARRAVQYHQQAAENALHRHAYEEAVLHLRQSIESLHSQSETPERLQQELGLHMTLGAALTVLKGYAAPEVEQTYTYAQALCRRLPESPQLFPVLHGLCRFFAVRADYVPARELGEQLLSIAQGRHDSALRLEAHWALGSVLFYLGELPDARRHLEQAVSIYNARQHHGHALIYGQDPGVASRAQLAWVLWFLGYPEQALRHAQEALTLARTLEHPFSVAFALYFLTILHQFRRDPRAVQERAAELRALSQQQGFLPWLALAALTSGSELARREPEGQGLQEMQHGIAVQRTIGATMASTYWLAALADTHKRSGRFHDSEQALADGFAFVTRTGEHNWESELYRLKGELLLATLREQKANLPLEGRNVIKRKKANE